MITTRFRDARGDVYANPDREFFKQMILDGGDAVWAVGSGGASIVCWKDGEPCAEVMLIGCEAHGFFIRHLHVDDEYDRTLVAGEHTGETVEAIVGGSEMRFWRETFVPKEMAWEAIEHFLSTGQRKQSLRWEEIDLPYNS